MSSQDTSKMNFDELWKKYKLSVGLYENYISDGYGDYTRFEKAFIPHTLGDRGKAIDLFFANSNNYLSLPFITKYITPHRLRLLKDNPIFGLLILEDLELVEFIKYYQSLQNEF